MSANTSTRRTGARRPHRRSVAAPTPPVRTRPWWVAAAVSAALAVLVCGVVLLRMPTQDRAGFAPFAIGTALAAAVCCVVFFHLRSRAGTIFATAAVSIGVFVAAVVFALAVPSCPSVGASNVSLERCSPVDAASQGFAVMLFPPFTVLTAVTARWMFQVMRAVVLFAVRRLRRS